MLILDKLIDNRYRGQSDSRNMPERLSEPITADGPRSSATEIEARMLTHTIDQAFTSAQLQLSYTDEP